MRRPTRSTPLPAGTEERRLRHQQATASAAVHGVLGNDLLWNFTAIPDTPPTIELDQGSRAAGARLAAARLQDGGRLRRCRSARRPSRSRTSRQPTKSRRRCSAAPDYALACRRRAPAPAPRKPRTILPSIRGPAPRLSMTLTARDEAGNEGRSEPREMTLPRAHFRQAAGARADRAAAHSGARRRCASRWC